MSLKQKGPNCLRLIGFFVILLIIIVCGFLWVVSSSPVPAILIAILSAIFGYFQLIPIIFPPPSSKPHPASGLSTPSPTPSPPSPTSTPSPTPPVHKILLTSSQKKKFMAAICYIIAAICYILFLVGGSIVFLILPWVGGSIIFLVEKIFFKKKHSPFIRAHARQSTIFFAILTVLYFVVFWIWHLVLGNFYSYTLYSHLYRPVLAACIITLIYWTVYTCCKGLIQSLKGQRTGLSPDYRNLPPFMSYVKKHPKLITGLVTYLIPLILAFIVLLSSSAVTSYGAMFGFDPRHTRNIPENILSSMNVSKLTLAWKYNCSCAMSSPTVANGNIYIGSVDTSFYAIDALSGKMRWNYFTGGPISSSPAVAGEIVYVGSTDHALYAVDATSGVQLWSYSTGDAIHSSPVVINGVFDQLFSKIVYIGSDDGNLYALDAQSGKQLWHHSTGSSIRSSPTVVNSELSGTIYIGSDDGSLYAFDARFGNEQWHYHTEKPIVSSPAVANGIVYIGSGDGKVYALDASTGQKLWSSSTGGPVFSSPAVANNVVYIGSADHVLYALDATTGKKLWSSSTGGIISSPPTVANGVVYIGSEDNTFYTFDATTGKRLWSYSTGNSISSSPVVVNGMAYIASEDGNLYAFHLSA